MLLQMPHTLSPKTWMAKFTDAQALPLPWPLCRRGNLSRRKLRWLFFRDQHCAVDHKVSILSICRRLGVLL